MNRDVVTAPARLSDSELLARIKALAGGEREATVALVAHLAVLDERRLYLGEGYPSLFSYCTRALRLSEHAAYGRIEAARMGRRFPVVFDLLEAGSVNLTTLCMLAAQLTEENHEELLAAIAHKSRRQVEEFIARIRPKPPVPVTVRKLPDRRPGVAPAVPVGAAANGQREGVASVGVDQAVSSAESLRLASPPNSLPAPPAVVEALAPERYRVQFTASAETCDKLRLAQDLLRHQVPDGDPAKIFDRALTALLEVLARQKFAAAGRPRDKSGGAPRSRHIPSQVKRTVWLRDGGRCAFVAPNGRRCAARGFLEFHHVTPHAAGGEPTPSNIQLRCRAHNHYEAELYFGQREPRVPGQVGAALQTTRSGPSCHEGVGDRRAPG
jgi:hypothetical protein